MNDEKGFYFLNLGYGHEKHMSFKNLVSMLIHVHLTFNVWLKKETTM